MWESEAGRYDDAYDSSERGGIVRARVALAVMLLGDGPGRVLDVGMGGGRLAAELARRGWDVSGVDPSQAMVELARGRLPGRAEHFALGRAEALVFPDGSFDAAAALGALEYTSEPATAIGEIARVLRPQGRAVLSWPDYRGLHHLWRGRMLYPVLRVLKRLVPFGRPVPPPPANPLSRKAFVDVCATAGLPVENVVCLDRRGRQRPPRLGGAFVSQFVFLVRRAA